MTLAVRGAPRHGLRNRIAPIYDSALDFVSLESMPMVTTDVHYASATWYNPARAKFTDFTPFWEFVSGPINAGTFGPGEIDQTFGPEVRYKSVPDGMKQNRPPTEGMQYFGTVKIDGATEVMSVALLDISGKTLYKTDLAPEG